MKISKIFASAGCGKTTALLEELDLLFQKGVKPEEVMFTTFTRSGAYEARDRAVQKFSLKEEKFIFFRTLHSICYRALNAPKIMTFQDYKNLGRELHCRFGSAGFGEELYERGKGDAMLSLYNLQRNRMEKQNLRPQDYGLTFSQQDYDHFVASYNAYRIQFGLHDYTDMLQEVLEEFMNMGFNGLPVKYAFIDEAQDLTQLQYAVVRVLAKNAREIFYAGDDDQAIYTYNGADPSILINLQGHKKILARSYRLPPAICRYGNEIAQRINVREEKIIEPFHTAKSEEQRCRRSAKLVGEIQDGEPTTILCRNRMFFSVFEEMLQQMGKVYTFQKAIDSDEELDRNNLQQLRRAVLTWSDALENQEKQFCQKDWLTTLQFMPMVLFQRPKRRTVLNASAADTFSYQDLVQLGMVAQNPWTASLTEVPWDARLYMELLERRGKLAEEPHIRIGTIHSFKGKEDDHVIVLPDMSWQTWKTYNDNPDSEHRVFYVAVTRARERLTLLEPITKYHYKW